MKPGSYRGDEVISKLVSLAESKLSDVTVIDGPAPNKPNVKKLLLVGWAPHIERHAVSTREDEDIVGRAVEVGEIACYIAVGHGDTTIGPVREAATEILTELEEAIRDADAADLAADEVAIGSTTLTQYQDRNEGASVGLAFAVTYRAYI